MISLSQVEIASCRPFKKYIIALASGQDLWLVLLLVLPYVVNCQTHTPGQCGLAGQPACPCCLSGHLRQVRTLCMLYIDWYSLFDLAQQAGNTVDLKPMEPRVWTAWHHGMPLSTAARAIFEDGMCYEVVTVL